LVVTLAALTARADTLEAMSDVGSDLSWCSRRASAMYGGQGPSAKYWSQMRKALGLTPEVPTTIHEALNITLEDAYVWRARERNESRKMVDCFGVRGSHLFTNFKL
jgi:hypothetical protein